MNFDLDLARTNQYALVSSPNFCYDDYSMFMVITVAIQLLGGAGTCTTKQYLQLQAFHQCRRQVTYPVYSLNLLAFPLT